MRSWEKSRLGFSPTPTRPHRRGWGLRDSFPRYFNASQARLMRVQASRRASVEVA
jgi:hypothetical protein